MGDVLSQIWKQLLSIWTRLGVNQRFTAVLVLVGTVAGISTLVWLAGRPDYQDLHGNLLPDEMQEITAALSEASVRYTTAGSVVRVDTRDMETARKALATKGLPTGGAGMKDLEGTGNLTLSKPLMNFKMQLVSAQMVEQMLVRMRQIRSAKVKCFFPEPRFFIGEKDDAKPTANVTLALRQGASLADVGHAVVTVVSSALGIARDNVSVVDSTGGTYHESNGMDATGAPMDRDALSLDRMESDTRSQRAQQALERVWPGKTVVRVDVKLDLTRETSQEKILPTERILLSEKKKEKSTTGGTTTGGEVSILAAAGTTPLAQPPGTLIKGAETKELESEKSWLESLGEKRTSRITPQIQRMTISLAIDQTLAEKQKDIEEFVKQSVGWDESRNDKVTSTVVPFPPAEIVPTASLFSFLDLAREYGSPVAQVISVGLALLFMRRLLMRSRRVNPAEISPQAGLADTGPEPDARKVRRDIEKVVAADPGAVTRLLQNWLVERS